MGQYKHIERSIGEYIASRYRRAVEVGIGNNPVAAGVVAAAGALMLCTDIRPGIQHEGLEMVPPLISLATRTNSDLLVYHLGCEVYRDGGEVVDAGGVQLHLYHRRRP